MLDIEKLRLTDEEREHLYYTYSEGDEGTLIRATADAQLAKLWGIADMIEKVHYEWTLDCRCGEVLASQIEQALEASGIPRPGHEGHTDCATCGTTTG